MKIEWLRERESDKRWEREKDEQRLIKMVYIEMKMYKYSTEKTKYIFKFF